MKDILSCAPTTAASTASSSAIHPPCATEGQLTLSESHDMQRAISMESDPRSSLGAACREAAAAMAVRSSPAGAASPTWTWRWRDLVAQVCSVVYLLQAIFRRSMGRVRRPVCRQSQDVDLGILIASSLLEVPVSNTKLTIPLGLKVVGEVIKRLNSITRRSDGTINRALADLLELKIAACEKPTNGVSTRDVVIDEATNVWVRIFTPEIVRPGSNSSSEEKVPVMVYYHGGGFGVLCANMLFYDRIGRTLAKTCQMIVVSVNYRRAPEHKFPIAYDDSFQALEWLRSPASARHLPAVADVSRTFLCGDSAGGNIVHFMGCRAAEIDLSPVQIRGLIPLQPYLGSEARVPSEINLVNVPVISVDATDWHWKAFLPEGADRDHPACNVFGPNAKDISGLNLPPMFVVVSTLDVLLDHQLHYVAKMQELGKDVTMKCYDGGIHGFYILEGVGIKLALTCIDDIHNFVQSCLLTVAAQ